MIPSPPSLLWQDQSPAYRVVERPVTGVGHEDDRKQGNDLHRRLESVAHQGVALWPPDVESFVHGLEKAIDQDLGTR